MSARYATAICVTTCLSLSLMSVATAQSSPRSTGWDLGVDVLYQFSKDIDFDGGSSLDVEDDIGLGFTFGYRFNPKVELQFSVDWNNVDYRGVLQSAELATLSAEVSGEMESFVPRVNGVYNFRDAPVTPYITAGLGWAFIDTNIPTGQVTIGCWWDPWWGEICTPYQPTKSVDYFLYQAGAGVRWDIGEAATMRFSYDKTWLDVNHATSVPGLDQLKVGFVYRY
jgi:opacity protein-like surface antigen